MADLNQETNQELISLIDELYEAFTMDHDVKLFEGGIVRVIPAGALPKYITVEIDGIYDPNVMWRGIPATLAVTDEVLVQQNPVTKRREVLGASGPSGISGGPHDILSATHSDTVAAAVVRGDLMTGQAAVPDWTRLPLGTQGYFLRSDGTDVLWSLFAGDTYIIGSGGYCDYPSISAWIAAAHATPATLFLQEDTFLEPVLVIPASVHLIGQGQGTIIDLQANSMLLNNDVSLHNLTITSSNANQTVDDNNGTGIVIRDCEIYNTAVAGNGYGIFSDGVLTVYDSVIDGYRAGIQGDNGTVSLWNCDVSGDLYGIRVNHASADWETLYCRFTGPTFDVYVIAGAWDHFACQFDPSNVSIAAGTHTALPTKRFNQTVIVAEEGGDFQLVSEAITWINAQGDAATGKRYGVLVLAGNFLEAGDVTIPAWVTVCGIGENSRIEFGANNLRMSDNSHLWNLVVYSTDGSTIDINNADCTLRSVKAINDGSGNFVVDIYGDSNCQLYDVIAEATGTVLYGFSVGNTATVLLDHCIADDTTNFTLAALVLSNAALNCTTRFCKFAGLADDIWVGASATWSSYKDTFDPGNFTSTGTITMEDVNAGDSFAFVVKNTSGATRVHGDVGYIDDAGEFQTTATAYLNVAWAVVVIGGANNADIWVARRGRVTVTLNGNCAIGDALYTSTTAAQAQPQSYVRPEMFAVALTANAAGAGGTCEALLHCHRKFVTVTSTSEMLRITAASFSSWASDIAAVAGAVVTYTAPGAPFVGNEDSIVPNYAVTPAHLCKLVLHNTTRGDFGLIQSVNIAANTITLTAAAPGAWAIGDLIQVNSLTCVAAGAPFFYDMEIISAEIPTLAVGLMIYHGLIDTGGIGYIFLHPYETYAISKQIARGTPAANVPDFMIAPIGIFQRRICIQLVPTGAATLAPGFWRMVGYTIATP